MVGLCSDNVDCPPNELCYVGATWLVVDVNASDAGGCRCNTFFGFEGPDCDIRSATTTITALWMSSAIVLCVYALLNYLGAARHFRRRGQLFQIANAQVVTMHLALVSTMCTGMWALMVLLSAVVIRGHGFLNFDFRDQYKGRYNAPSLLFAPASIALGALALLHVSLIWMEIVSHSGRMSKRQQHRLTHTKRLVYVFEFVAIVVGVTGAAIEKSTGRSVNGFLFAPLVLFVIATYLAGSYKLNSLIYASTLQVKDLEIPAVPPPQDVSSSWVESWPGTREGRPEEPPKASPKISASRAWRLPERFKRSPSMSTAPSQASTEGAGDTAGPGQMVVEPDDVFRRVMRKIRRTARGICVALLLFLIAQVGISSVDAAYDAGWKETIEPGDVLSAYKVFHHLQLTSLAMASVIVSIYIRSGQIRE